MRDIKFRAWDEGQMVSHDDQLWHMSMDGDLVYDSGSCGDKGCDDAILMQFTGQLDIKDNQIYEGDILHCTHFGLIAVEWCEWGYWKGSPVNFDREKGQGDARDYGMLFTFGSGFEIVGNIHENPELMEDK
jgi:hypothetical protein